MRRGSGVLLHISSLPGNYGIGSFGREARAFLGFLADCGFCYWQMLPFCMPDCYHSPYKSVSAFSCNPYFIDLPDLKERGLLSDRELAEERQASPYLCEFDRLAQTRLALLGKAAERAAADSVMSRKIDVFLQGHPQVELFCRYMEQKGTYTKQVWAFTQYMLSVQWKTVKDYAARRGIQLIGDLPMYVDCNSADLWASPHLFQLDAQGNPVCVAGVPPDYFSPDGQLWGNPLYHWEEMKKDGYAWWRQRMAYLFEFFDGVRIDHFRGIASYFSIPAGAETARDGVWRPGPGTAFVDCLREAAAGRLIIAEDLGTVTDQVEALVAYSGFPGTRVLQFGFSQKDSPHLPHNYGANTAAYTGTHDNNTLLGYIWELDPENRQRLFEYCGCEMEDWNKCCDAVLRTMLASHAGLVLFPIQDLLHFGSDTRMNRPGIGSGNWRYRVTEEQLASVDRDKFRRWNSLYGRIHENG